MKLNEMVLGARCLVLAAALVAGAGASAWAEDAPEEEVVAFGEAEFWLGGDEVAVASGEGEFWLGPEGLPVGEGAWLVQTDGGSYIVGTGAATALPDGFDRNSITGAVVGDGITEIGAKFFEDCYALNTIKIGRDVGKIGEKAFWFCMSLEKVEIGNPDFDLGSLDKAIVYQTAIDRDGTPYPIPDVSVSGCLQMLFGKRELTDADWTELGAVGEKPMTEYGEYRFFRIVLKKKGE